MVVFIVLAALIAVIDGFAPRNVRQMALGGKSRILCTTGTEETDTAIDAATLLNGKDRRMLRAIAARMIQKGRDESSKGYFPTLEVVSVNLNKIEGAGFLSSVRSMANVARMRHGKVSSLPTRGGMSTFLPQTSFLIVFCSPLSRTPSQPNPFITHHTQVDEILQAREIVKIKVLGQDVKRKAVKELGLALTASTQSILIQTVGHTLLVYREHDKEITELLRLERKKSENN